MNRRNFQHRFKAPQVKGKNTIAIIFIAFAFSILSGLTQAQTLGVYAFTGSNGCNSVEVTTQPSNATFGSYSSVNTACENTSNIFERDQWNTATTINTSEYNQFSITPASGYVLNLTNITFTQEMSFNNSTTWALRSSLDSYAANIATGTATTSSQSPSITLSGFTNIGAVTFRLYIINANSSLTDWSNDNVTLSGTVTLACTAPTAPGNPTSDSPQCSTPGVTITKSGSAPSGVTWYWQGTNSAGTSTASNATGSYNASTTGTYYIRAQDNTGLCWSASSGSIAVTVNQLPTITLGSNPGICAGTTTANLTYSATTDSPDLYSIDYDATAEAAGFTDVVNATLPGTPIVLVVPSGAATGTYNYTVSVKNNTTGCVGTGVAKTITINALPTITLSSNPTVCSGSTSANLSYSATTDSPDKYSIDYDATAEAAGFTDVVNAALPSSPIVIIVPAGAASGTYNYNVSVKNNTTGCVGTSTAKTITLTPAPSITLGSDPSVCSGITTANLTYSSTNNSPDQYSINYDAAAEAAGFTDVVNATLPSSPITLVVPSGAAAAAYNYTVSVKNTTTGCTSSVTSKTITVNPAPTITLGSNPSVCLGTTTANLTFSATTQSPDKYSIDYDATAEAAGFTDIVNAALPASPIVLTVPSAPASGTYNFTVTVKNNTTGCTGIAIGKTISIAAPSTVTPGGPDIALQSASPSPITLSGASVGGSATTAAWSITSGGGTLSSTSQTSSPQTVTYTPAANYTGAVVLTLTTNAGTCSAASGTRNITVNPATVQTFTTTTNFTIPECVSQITVEAWGAGGGAGGSDAGDGGSGGGGGAFSSITLSVTPQTTYSVHVGTGGAGGTPNNSGAAGGDSWFNNSSTVLAKGGSGGGASAGAIGVGGSSGAGIGTVLYSGGNGGLGNGSGGGGGGSSAGTAANGNNGQNKSSGGAGGAAPNGGGAGANGNGTTNGYSGNIPGGAGAGGDDESDVSGGAGARGQIILRWTASLSIGNNPVAASDVCANTSNVPLHSFSLQGDNSCVTDVNFVTTGNYISAEISNFKLYYTTTNTFSTSNLLATITSPTTAGTQTFPAFSLPVGTGSDKYLWITMDVASTVTNGHAIAVNGTSPSNITASVIVTGSGNASGTQTLKPNASITLTSAVGTNNQTVCINTAITDITYSIAGGGTGASVTGLPDGVAGNYNSGTITVSGTPSVAGTFNYTVNTTGTCTQTSSTGTIVINPLPTVGSTVSPSDAVCAGSSVTLSGSGASTYSWTGGVTDGVSFVPTSTTTYTVTGTDENGCMNTATKIITVNALPVITANSATVCLGESATLTAAGGTTYLWSTGETTDEITVTTSSNTTYTVTGTTTGCSASALANVTINGSFTIYGETIDVNCSTNTLGSINLNPLCGQAPYSFLWSNGSTTQNLTDLTEGIYEVRATDNIGTLVKKQFIIYTCTQWTDNIDVSLNSNTLTKTSSDGWANAGAKSKNLIYKNDVGAIKYVVEDLTKSFVVGLSEEGKYDLLTTNTTSAFAIKNDTLQVFIHGNLTNSYEGIMQGDKIELVQSPQSITFYKNDNVLFTVDSINQAPLKVDFIPYKQNSSVSDIKSSFGLPQFFINTQLLNDPINDIDSINVIVISSSITDTSLSGITKVFALPVAFVDSTENFTLKFAKEDLLETTLKCVTSKYGTVKSLSFYDDSTVTYTALDSSFYEVKNSHELILLPIGRSTAELADDPKVYLDLEGGLVLSPNGDNSFDYLTLVGKEWVDVFEITIYDLSNTEVFHSTQKNFSWDGRNYSSNLVEGTYSYTMNINNQLFSGVFLTDF